MKESSGFRVLAVTIVTVSETTQRTALVGGCIRLHTLCHSLLSIHANMFQRKIFVCIDAHFTDEVKYVVLTLSIFLCRVPVRILYLH